MKKAERILGILAISSFSLGLIFKNLAWPGAYVLLNLALFSFNFGYLPVHLIHQRRKSKSVLFLVYLIIKFITFFIIMSGFVFKFMHWPGASILLSVINVALPCYLLFYFYLRFINKGMIPFSLDDFVIAVLAYVIHLYVIQTLVSPSVVKGYVIIESQFKTVNAGIESANGLIYSSIDSISQKDNQVLLTSIQKLRSESKIVSNLNDSLRNEFLKYSTNSDYTGNKGLTHFGGQILADGDKGYEFFIELKNGKKLEDRIDQYFYEILTISDQYNLKSTLIGNGLVTDDFKNRRGIILTWREKMFGNLPVAAVFTNLSWINQMILLTESAVLNGLISQIDLSDETILLQELAARESDRSIKLKEDEIFRIKQQQELQQLQLEKSQSELRERNTIILFALIGITFVLILFFLSTRAYFLKQKDNKMLALQKDEISEKNKELNQQNDEIAAQRDEIEAQRDLVTTQKDQIEKTHNEISASIDYATRLQTSILPDPDLLNEYFSEHFILFRPRDKVSGDFYWWSMVKKQIVIAAADCTGHGVPGAFMSMLGISLLSEIVNKAFTTNPGAILDKLRKEVIRSLNQKGRIEEQKDGLDISILTIDTETWNCKYAGANNPFYLIRGNDLKEYKPDMMPISIYHRMEKFSTHEIQLEPGDQLYLFSDGYADQFGGKDRKKFKYKPFKRLLVDQSPNSMEHQKMVLTETIVEWKGADEQIDDMVVVGLRV